MSAAPIPQIDFGAVVQQQVKQARAKPVPHVYFGPKDPETGEPLPEPVYEHQEFPKVMYTLENGQPRGIQVDSLEQLDALDPAKWFDTPAKFGLITAPTFDQSRQTQRLAMPDGGEKGGKGR